MVACVALITTALASCSKEQPQGSAGAGTIGDSITIALTLEAGIDSEDLRVWGHELKDKNNVLLPTNTLADGDIVQVHTAIKSSDGLFFAKTLPWKYYADSKLLKLEGEQAFISLGTSEGQFTNDNNRRWYITGMIGGTLNESTGEVIMTPRQELKGYNSSSTDKSLDLDIPYAFMWSELKIKILSTKPYNHGGALVKPVVFKPRGSVIGFSLGNAIYGSDALQPISFSVSSRAYGDQGSFNLNGTNFGEGDRLPAWRPQVSCGWSLFTFAPGHEPEAIEQGATSSKIYYAWMMPANNPPATADTRINIRFKDTPFPTDLTRTYFTDYAAAEGKGKITHGKVYRLTARATKNIEAPMQYIMPYNLAGGDGLTATLPTTPASPGAHGFLRFSNREPNEQTSLTTDPHANNASGYYSWYASDKAAGSAAGVPYLEDEYLIDVGNEQILLKDKYRIPELDDLWGFFPAQRTAEISWTQTNTVVKEEYVKIGGSTGPYTSIQNYTSEYSPAYYLNGASNTTGDAVIYALRFQKLRECRTGDYTFNGVRRNYPPASDDAIKSAFRYRRVGRSSLWTTGTGDPGKPSADGSAKRPPPRPKTCLGRGGSL